MKDERTPILEVENLKMTFVSGKRGRKVTVNAIDDNSFKVYEGETFGLVGESGCGKTTTGRTIIRLYNPTAGKMTLMGRDISGPMNKELRHFLTDNVAMIFQDPIDSLNPRMTVEEIVAEGLKYHGMTDASQRKALVLDMLNKVGLTHEHASRYPHEFSGGQRQRIGIARALVVKPKLIIADEPVSALDVSVQAQVINLLNDLKEELGLTIIFIAHDLSVVKYFSTRVAVMYYGKIVEMAPSDELYRHPLHPYTRALVVKPKLIIADEPVSALDVSVQAQVINLLNDLKEELGLTIIFIAHDLSVVKYFSTRVAVMYYGKIVEMAPSDELYRHPLHPYTRALLSAVPQPDPIFEKQRQRMHYDPKVDHIEAADPRMMREILPEHFVYANIPELERYKTML